MRQERLNDAAITLSRVLTENNVKHGLFGGCATTALGGPSEAKDIDCLVAGDMQRMLDLLGKDGFRAIPQAGENYVAFSWNDASGGQEKLVPAGAMQSVIPKVIRVRGERLGEGPTSLLDEVYLFKGKLRAAAVRAKASDAADITYLVSTLPDKLRTNANRFDLYYVGLALKRYPHLLPVIQGIGIDVGAAEGRVKGISLETLPPPQPGDIQKNLLE
ncbi:hypothetical protein FGG08_003087 [Glutinoglossum americanum]|uniref:Nucleotidyltransferase family protein n=1 Tax=Glutinoglossum americanum TaxID=1670608 RepID=A0A9P8L0Z4_9PEZI|nr:hypothetical protein FGG08_003087 [Glutinoglossum americanum]